jgi:16S rRNA U516 pseudouridylate synthase RsuA-like enzyme
LFTFAYGENLKRLNKFIGENRLCSRREADKIIEQGRVTINGIVPSWYKVPLMTKYVLMAN